MNEKVVVESLLEQCQDRARNCQNNPNNGMISSMLQSDKCYYIRGPHNIEHLIKRISKTTKIPQLRIKKVLLQVGTVNRRGEYYISTDLIGKDGKLSNLLVKLRKKLSNGTSRGIAFKIEEPLSADAELKVSGRLKSDGKSIYLEPINTRKFGNRIEIIKVNDFVRSLVGSGSVVVVKTKQGGATEQTTGYGEVIGTPIGRDIDPAIGIASILADGGYSEDFESLVMEEVSKLPLAVSENEIEELRIEYSTFEDWRGTRFVTIDPRSCKDMDDSVYCRILPDGNIELKVAIALVANYVKKGSATFNEAVSRGNSVYVGDKVCAMLPKHLSNNICSINPGQDRFALGGHFIISKDGQILSSEIKPVVVRSRHKMAYDTVDSIFYGTNEELKQTYANSIKHFEALRELDNILRPKSKRNGFLQLEDNEATFRLSEDRTKVERVYNDNRTTAHKMVETAMLLFNEEFAKTCEANNVPIIYRVEPGISIEEQEKICNLLATLNLPLVFDDNLDIRTTINCAVDEAIAKDKANRSRIISNSSSDLPKGLIDLYPFTNTLYHAIIRSLPRAEYKASNIGHFATAKAVYTHITSPIRRTCDLVNQLQFLAFLSNKEYPFDIEELSNICSHINKTEYNADVAERKGDDVLSSIYAGDNLIGKQMCASVRSINQEGINLVCGPFNIVVPITGVGARYDYNRDKHYVFDKLTRRKIKFARTYVIRIESVDKCKGTIYGDIVSQLNKNHELELNDKTNEVTL